VVAEVTTTSADAWRLYVEGLSAFRAGDGRVADRFFRAALGVDSNFAMATYYAARTTDAYDRHEGFQLLNRARDLAARASDRDRLVIHAYHAFVMNDPALGRIADSLVARFPALAHGHYMRGANLVADGSFLQAVPHLERAIALDSLSL
jgi:hypothetical protein